MNERLQESSEELVEKQTEWALAATRAAAARRQCDDPQFVDWDGEHCVECEVPIPPARIAMGKVRCTPCQAFIEEGR
jgi:hypothetical protein